MDMKIRELPKKCPFCHDIPTLAKYPLWNDRGGYRGSYEYYVACKNKNCKIQPRTRAYNDIYNMTEQECFDSSIKDWNDR